LSFIMLRFAILEHDWPTLHWDLLLEADAVLRAWRLLEDPGEGRAVPAEANFDHRLMYLEYEGPITGDRGNVTRWDAGEYDWVSNEPPTINLRGGKLRGRFEIANGQFRRVSGD
jgi:hypothetical protein